MILRSLRARQFEKRVGQHARLRIRSSAALSREYRRARRANREWIKVIGRCFAAFTIFVMQPCYIYFFLMQVLRQQGVGLPDFVLTLFSVFSMAAAFRFASSLHGRLRQSVDMNVLAFLPISDGRVVKLQYLRLIWIASPGLITCLTFYVTWLMTNNLNAVKSAAVIATGFAQFGMIVATAAVFTAFNPRLLRGLSKTLLALLPVAIFSLLIPGFQPVLQWFVGEEFTLFCFALLPTGWLNGVLTWGVLDGMVFAAWLLAPLLLFLVAIPAAINRLKTLSQIHEYSFEQQSTLQTVFVKPKLWEADDVDLLKLFQRRRSTDDSPDEPATPEMADDQVRKPISAARDKVLAGKFLHWPAWAREGVIERIVAAWLTPRERLVAQFLVGGQPLWTAYWGMAATIGVIGSTALLLFGESPFAVILLMLGLVGIAFLQFLGAWPGLQWKSATGMLSPAFCYAPIATKEITRFIMVLGCVRAMFFLPLYAGIGAIAGFVFGIEIGLWLLMAAKWCFISVVLHQWWFACVTAQSDSRSWFLKIIRAVVAAVWIIFFGICLVGFFAIPFEEELYTMVCASIVVGMSWVTAKFNEGEHNSAPIDLLAPDRTNAKRAKRLW